MLVIFGWLVPMLPYQRMLIKLHHKGPNTIYNCCKIYTRNINKFLSIPTGEVGTRYLDCEWSCCYLDHSEECSFRDYYIFYLQTAFAEPFDEPPLVSVSAVANWKRFSKDVFFKYMLHCHGLKEK